MMSVSSTTTDSTSVRSTIGLILCRGVVPAWVLLGATLKLYTGDPSLLPKTFFELKEGGVDIELLLYVFIALEIFAVGVMLLLGRYARLMAAFILSVFCVVLIIDMINGAKSCGCFGGSFHPKPWQMLIVDGGMLLGVLFLAPKRPSTPATSKRPALIAAAFFLALGFGISFGGKAILHPPPKDDVIKNDDKNDDKPVIVPLALQATWFAQDVASWVGKPWREIDIFRMMRTLPDIDNLDNGVRYVVFYSRTCDHCEDMFWDHLSDPALGRMVTAIEIPADRDFMRDEFEAWEMPDTECELLALPLGCLWLIEAPMALRLEDGVVTCAVEGDHLRCFYLE